MEVKLTAILNLEPEVARQLHPLGVKWFDERRAAIEKQLTIDGLTVNDIETFLIATLIRASRSQLSPVRLLHSYCLTVLHFPIGPAFHTATLH